MRSEKRRHGRKNAKHQHGGNDTRSLQRFTLEELAPFTKEGVFASNASGDFHLFYVGRDDAHGVLKYLLSRTTTSLYMFGYDDEELNEECMRCAMDRSVTTVITLDKSQSGGKHERAILASDVAKDPVAFQTHVVGEGTFVVTGGPGGPGYKAQNNTLAVFTDPCAIARFTAELVAEHLAAHANQAHASRKGGQPGIE
jgi:hypothetical protein